QDHVVIDLRDRVAVPAPRGGARPVRRDDLAVNLGGRAREPGEERGADVEGDLLEVVDDVENAIGVVDTARGRVRCAERRPGGIAPSGCARWRVRALDAREPWIRAGRLIEVSVGADEAPRRHGYPSGWNASSPDRNSRRPPRGTTTSPEESTKCRR